MTKRKIFIILHNIRSLHNVGAIFRTADGAGIDKIYLTGYTPTPIDVFGKTRKEIRKTALGAENYVKWEKIKDVGKLIARLKKDGVFVVAVEQGAGVINYKKFNPRADKPLALIFGNEVRGLSNNILKKCDKTIEIPMLGKKESLNVSVAVGIVIYSLV